MRGDKDQTDSTHGVQQRCAISALNDGSQILSALFFTQAAMEAKQEELRKLDRGAAAVQRAAQPPCTDLDVDAVLSKLQPAQPPSVQLHAQLPRPLSVLACELQAAAQLYNIPAQAGSASRQSPCKHRADTMQMPCRNRMTGTQSGCWLQTWQCCHVQGVSIAGKPALRVAHVHGIVSALCVHAGDLQRRYACSISCCAAPRWQAAH